MPGEEATLPVDGRPNRLNAVSTNSRSSVVPQESDPRASDQAPAECSAQTQLESDDQSQWQKVLSHPKAGRTRLFHFCASLFAISFIMH